MGLLFLHDASKRKQKPMDCVPWVTCFVVFKAHGLRSMGLLFLLAHEYTAGVGWVATVEGEQ